MWLGAKKDRKKISTDQKNKSLHDYSGTINIYFTLQCIIVQGIFAGKKCTKQTLNILISIPTTDGQEKKSLSK